MPAYHTNNAGKIVEIVYCGGGDASTQQQNHIGNETRHVVSRYYIVVSIFKAHIHTEEVHLLVAEFDWDSYCIRHTFFLLMDFFCK